MNRKIHIITFGCQMNKHDSELFAQALEDAGHQLTEEIADADTVLFNTCSVRDQAENRVLSAIGMLKERKAADPHFLIGVMGCMAQRWGESLYKKYRDVDMVVGTREFHRIADIIAEAEKGPIFAIEENSLTATGILPEKRHRKGEASAFTAVMRGCNNYCSYCIVPYVRGREESRSSNDILKEIKSSVSEGAIEITLLGQNICAWGKDLEPPLYIADLLRQAGSITGLKRLRFISSHPKDIKKELFEAIADTPAVCEILQVSAQSGSDKILEAMNRKYTRSHYDEIIHLGRELVPDIAYCSDFIVGFPGETEKDFLKTLELVEQTEFLNIFAFRYSPRPGTKAADLKDDVPQQEKEDRLQALLNAQKKVNDRRNKKLVDEKSVQKILVEGISKKDENKLTGRNRHGSIVVFAAPADKAEIEKLTGQEVAVKITGSTTLTLFGELIND